MNTHLSERIRQCSPSFSKGQRAIAKYIEEHSDKVAFMTANRLGETVGVSESTVVRFATELGYSGYPALQQAMQEMVKSKMTTVQRLERTYSNLSKEDLLNSVFEQDIHTIKRTREITSSEDFHNAASALANSQRIYIIGAGSSLALATFMANYFELMFDTVQLLEASSESKNYQKMMNLTENDAVIVVSFPRYSRKAARALEYSAKRGAETIAITDSSLSPLAKNAKHLLLARSDMVSFVDSLVAPLSLINALIVRVAIEKKQAVAQNLERIENIWDAYGIYEKVDEKTENT